MFVGITYVSGDIHVRVEMGKEECVDHFSQCRHRSHQQKHS